jgi:hypothetical protein
MCQQHQEGFTEDEDSRLEPNFENLLRDDPYYRTQTALEALIPLIGTPIGDKALLRVGHHRYCMKAALALVIRHGGGHLSDIELRY